MPRYYMAILLFEFPCVHLDLIQYVWQLVFAYVPIQGWITESNENGFFNWSGKVLLLPPHSSEVVYSCCMTCGIVMVIDGWGGFKCSLILWVILFLLCDEFFLVLLEPFVDLPGLFLILALFRAQLGYLQSCIACLRQPSSLALCVKV